MQSINQKIMNMEKNLKKKLKKNLMKLEIKNCRLSFHSFILTAKKAGKATDTQKEAAKKKKSIFDDFKDLFTVSDKKRAELSKNANEKGAGAAADNARSSPVHPAIAPTRY